MKYGTHSGKAKIYNFLLLNIATKLMENAFLCGLTRQTHVRLHYIFGMYLSYSNVRAMYNDSILFNSLLFVNELGPLGGVHVLYLYLF